MIICEEVITPPIALAYLSHNKANRNIHRKKLEQLVRDMKSGKWTLTHQAIAFDESGNLIDGQHRLTAVVESGATVKMLVARGLPTDAILNIDTGAARLISDVYKITDELLGYDGDPVMRNKNTVSAVRSLVYCGYNQAIALTNSEIAVLMDSFEPYLRKLYKIALTRKKAVSAPVAAAILAALLCGEDEETLYRFVSVFVNGDTTDCEGLNSNAAFRLSTALLEAKVKHVKLTRPNLYRLSQNSIWQFIHGSDTKQLKNTKTARYLVSAKIKAILGDNTNDDDP